MASVIFIMVNADLYSGAELSLNLFLHFLYLEHPNRSALIVSKALKVNVPLSYSMACRSEGLEVQQGYHSWCRRKFTTYMCLHGSPLLII